MEKQKTGGKKTALLGIFLFFVLSLIPRQAAAGVISMATTVTPDVLTENVTTVGVELTNFGDEAAYDVQISPLLPEGLESKPVFVGVLEPNMSFEGGFNATLAKEIALGRYPLVVLTDYADANGYPFSSVSTAFIVYKTPTISMVSGVISDLALTGKDSKKLVLTIRNLDEIQHDVKVKLNLPREINGDVENVVSVLPKEEKQLDFYASSFSALPGSSYAVSASMEYDEKGLHYTSFANGFITTGEGAAPKQESRETGALAYMVLFISILFVLIYVYSKYIKRGRKVEKKRK